MFWYTRWFILIVLATGYLAGILTSIIGFSLTKNYYYFSFLSPAIFIPTIKYLIPPDEKTYQLRRLKIETDAENKLHRLRLKEQHRQQKFTKKQESS